MTSRTGPEDPFLVSVFSTVAVASLRLALAQQATEEAGAVMNPSGGVGVTLMLKE